MCIKSLLLVAAMLTGSASCTSKDAETETKAEASPGGVELVEIPVREPPRIEVLDQGQEPRQPLRLVVAPGLEETMEMTMDMRMSMTIPGQAMPSIPVPTTKTRLKAKVESVTGDSFQMRQSVTDVEVIPVDGRELQVIYAPGHAQHHLAILDRSVQGLFCGEALGIPVHRTLPLAFPSVAPPNFDPELYLSTIEKLRRLQPHVVFYSHGPVVTRDPESLMDSVAQNTQAFGDLILNALRQGKPEEEVRRRLNDFMAGSLGIRMDEGGLAMTVGGYAVYYRSKGLV